jgi:hypothetical protein
VKGAPLRFGREDVVDKGSGGCDGGGERTGMQLAGQVPDTNPSRKTTFEERGILKNKMTYCWTETVIVGGCSGEWARRRFLQASNTKITRLL